MSPQSFVELLVSPFAIVFLLVVAVVSTWLLSAFLLPGPSRIGVYRILNGYVAVIVVMTAIGWLFDFFSNEKSWVSSVFWTYFAVLVMAVLGVPIVGFLTAIGRGLVPWCLLGSLGIALLLTPAYFAMGDLSSRSLAGWFSHILIFAAFSSFSMLVFCLGARIPWRRPTR